MYQQLKMILDHWTIKMFHFISTSYSKFVKCNVDIFKIVNNYIMFLMEVIKQRNKKGFDILINFLRSKPRSKNKGEKYIRLRMRGCCLL